MADAALRSELLPPFESKESFEVKPRADHAILDLVQFLLDFKVQSHFLRFVEGIGYGSVTLLIPRSRHLWSA